MSKVTDPDLMMLADGELDAAHASALERAAGPNGTVKVAAVREVGDLVRGHLELAADDAEDRLSGLWDLVERRIDAPDTATPAREKAKAAAEPGLWSRLVRWFDGHRAHLLTGALSAGAVAALAFVLREEPRVEIRTVQVEVPAKAGAGVDAGGGEPMILVATPPEVESLDVNGGTGTVFTIEDEDGGTETAVIWVTPDDVLEGI